MSDQDKPDPPQDTERVETGDFTPLEVVPKGCGCAAEGCLQVLCAVVSVVIGALSLKLAGVDLERMDPDLALGVGGVILLVMLSLAALIHRLFTGKSPSAPTQAKNERSRQS